MFGVKQKKRCNNRCTVNGVLWFGFVVCSFGKKECQNWFADSFIATVLATFGNALCKDVAPIGVFGGVCLQAAARDFQCASVRLGKGLIFDKRRSCRQKQKFFQKIRKVQLHKKNKERGD